MSGISPDDLDLLGPVTTSHSTKPTTIPGGRKDTPRVSPHFHPTSAQRWVLAMSIVPVTGGWREVEIDIANPRIEPSGTIYYRTPSGSFIDRRFLCGFDKLEDMKTVLRHVSAIQKKIDDLQTLQLGAVRRATSIALSSTLEGQSPQMSILEGLESL